MKHISVRLTDQDFEKLGEICSRRGLQQSEAIRMLLRDETEQVNAIVEIQSLKELIEKMQPRTGDTTRQNTEIDNELIKKILIYCARNYLATLQLAAAEKGDNLALSIDTISRKNATELINGGKTNLKAM